jgi:hypothetical protein
MGEWARLLRDTEAAEALVAVLRDGTAYGDEKVANRDTRVWHGATEKGP